MNNKNYLIFSWHGLRYGIEANLVQEMFLLPELTTVVEAPHDIVGVLNLRSKIVPIMHLDLRLGMPMQECQTSDGVVVFSWQGIQVGAIINSVDEVKTIASEAIEPQIDYGRVSEINTAFVAGVVKDDQDLIVLLDPETLVRHSEAVKELVSNETNGNSAEEFEEKSETALRDFYAICCPHATAKDKELFRQRAESLKQSTEDAEDSTRVMPLAVVELNGEYFGLDLEIVREFIDVDKISPIPCCPNHITGNLNLRGEILTLVDIRKLLNFPLAEMGTIAKAAVVKVNDLVAGLPVDQVFDVEYFRPSDIQPVPAAVASGGEAYLRGIVPYADKNLSIIDLPKMFSQGGLEVNEEV